MMEIKSRQYLKYNIHISKQHLQDDIHISEKNISIVTAISLRNIGPNASNENSPDVKAAAAMCQYAYWSLNQSQGKTKEKADLIDGWKAMTDSEVNNEIEMGLSVKFKRTCSGFNSMMFKKDFEGIRYYAYCTEGTEMTSPKDWFSNISQGLIGLSPQYTYSVQIAKRLDKAIGDSAVLWFIGHSLGGGLASNNSLATGRHAITFNAAGLNILRTKATLFLNNQKYLFKYQNRSNRIHAFVLEGELLNSVLSKIAEPAYGNRNQIKYIGNKNSLGRHSLTTILDEIGVNWHYDNSI